MGCREGWQGLAAGTLLAKWRLGVKFEPPTKGVFPGVVQNFAGFNGITFTFSGIKLAGTFLAPVRVVRMADLVASYMA